MEMGPQAGKSHKTIEVTLAETGEESVTPAQSSADVSPSTQRRRSSLLMLPLVLSIMVIMLDNYTIAPAMPTIAVEFSANDASFAWIESAEQLAWAVAVPIYGRSSDYFGRKAMIQSAVIVSFVGTIVGGFSNSIGMLLAGRAIQGLGCGGVAVMSNICVADLFSGRDRGIYFSILGTVTGITSAVGPSIGGALTGFASWRWCFWMNLPITAVALVSIHVLLDLPKSEGSFLDGLKAIDWPGVGLIVIATLLLLVGLQLGGTMFPWNSPIVLSMLVLGAATFVVFAVVEPRVSRPLIPLHIFRHRSRVATTAVMFGQSLLSISCKLFLTLYFQLSLGVSPLRSAVYLLPFALGTAAIFPLGGWLVKRTGKYRFLMCFGAPFLVLGSGLMIASRPYTYWPLIVIPQLLLAVGQGFTYQSPTIAFQAQLRRADIAAGQSAFNFLRTFAEMLSAVLGTVIFQTRVLAQTDRLIGVGLTPALLDQLASGRAIASISAIQGLPAPQREAVDVVTTAAFSSMWIFYTLIAAVTFGVTFGVSDVDMDAQEEESEAQVGNERKVNKGDTD